MDETLDVDRPYPSVEKTSLRLRVGVQALIEHEELMRGSVPPS